MVWKVIRPDDFLNRDWCWYLDLSSWGELNKDAANDAIWTHSTLMSLWEISSFGALIGGRWTIFTFIYRFQSFWHSWSCLVAYPCLASSSLCFVVQLDWVVLCRKPGQKILKHIFVNTRCKIRTSLIPWLLPRHRDPLTKNPVAQLDTANASLFASKFEFFPLGANVFTSLSVDGFPSRLIGLGWVNDTWWDVSQWPVCVYLWFCCCLRA